LASKLNATDSTICEMTMNNKLLTPNPSGWGLLSGVTPCRVHTRVITGSIGKAESTLDDTAWQFRSDGVAT
jgi:hypothetical protein